MALFALAGFIVSDVLLKVWGTVSMKTIDDLCPRFATLHMDMQTLPVYLFLWGIGMCLIICVGGIYNILIIALTIVFVVYQVPRIVLQDMIRRRERLVRDQMVGVLPLVINSVRAGLSLEEAIETASQETPAPLAKELRRIVEEYEHGRPFSKALEDAKERLHVESFAVFVTAMTTTSKQGGNVSIVLDRLRKSLEENQRLERKLIAETASGNLVITILTFFPLGYLLFSLMTNFEGTSIFFTNLIGQILLSIAILFCNAGYKLGRYYMNIEF